MARRGGQVARRGGQVARRGSGFTGPTDEKRMVADLPWIWPSEAVTEGSGRRQ